jgi:hypothetical protein
MKTILTLLLLTFLPAGITYPQLKVKLKLVNPGIDAQGKFYFKLAAVVQTGQTWRVGTSNIRIDFRTIPPVNVLTVFPDSIPGSVQEPLACINSGNYSGLTTIAISGGTAISFNITRISACCTLTAGTYILGRIRFTRGTDTGCTKDTIRSSSGIRDSITLLTYGTEWIDSNYTTCIPVSVISGTQLIPSIFKLHNNYPNPFNPVTTIKYDLPKSAHVMITIYDMLGKEAGVLVNETKPAGYYEVQWDARNFSSGAYMYKMETDSYTEIKKMMLIK